MLIAFQRAVVTVGEATNLRIFGCFINDTFECS